MKFHSTKLNKEPIHLKKSTFFPFIMVIKKLNQVLKTRPSPTHFINKNYYKIKIIFIIKTITLIYKTITRTFSYINLSYNRVLLFTRKDNYFRKKMLKKKDFKLSTPKGSFSNSMRLENNFKKKFNQ